MTDRFARIRRVALTGAILAATVVPGLAQEPSAAHVDAAKAAVEAIGATRQFDNILLGAALNLKRELIQLSPDQEAIISATVDETALNLAGRRGDLETEAARVYASYFTQEELNAIAEFYSSTAGQKLLAEGPKATRDVLRAADIWGRGIARDLASETNTALNARLGGTTDPNVAVDGTPQAPQTQ